MTLGHTGFPGPGGGEGLSSMSSNLQQVQRVSVKSLGSSLWLALIVAVAGSTVVFFGWQKFRLGTPADWVALALGILAVLFLGAAILLERVYRGRLQKSEERYRQLFENNPAGVYRSVQEGQLQDCNSAFAALFGYDKQEILKKNAKELYADLKDREDLLSLVHSQGHAQIEAQFIRSNNTAFWGLLRATSLSFPGEPLVFEGTILDVTERRSSQVALQEFSKIASDYEVRFQERLERLLSVGCEFLEAEIGAFWKVTGNTLQIESQAGADLLPPNTSFTLEETYAGKVARHGRLASFRKAEESWLKDYAVVRPFPLEAYIGIPVLVSGRVAGILDFGKRTPRSFGQTHEAFMELIASWLGGELERQRLEKESRCLTFLMEFLPTCNTIKEALDFFTPKWDEFFPGSAGAVYLDHEGEGLPEASKWGDEAGELPVVLLKSDCWASRMNRLSLSTQEKEFPCKHVAGLSQYEHFCLPMMARGKSWGVLYVRFVPAVEVPGRSLSAVRESRRRLAAAVSEHLAMSLANLDLREQLKIQAERDPLTKLFNRKYLDHWLDLGTEGQDTRLGIIMIDLDNFGTINKKHSHHTGDHVLAELGDFMRRWVRQGDKVFRYGGEEFVVVLEGVTLDITQRRAENLRHELKNLKMRFNGESLEQLTLSAGVAALPDHGDLRKNVLMTAERAMRQSKEAGKDRVTVASSAG
jgi:diguanylate cyclase (GGDEF)-like protein/PAS domain S-box-containing protein